MEHKMNTIVDAWYIATLYLVKESTMYNMYRFLKCILHTSDYFIQLSTKSECLLCRVEWCSLVPGSVLCCVVCRGRYCIIIKVSWWDCWGPATVTLNGFTLHSRHIFCCGSVATAGRSVLRLSGPLLILANIILRWLKLVLHAVFQRIISKTA